MSKLKATFVRYLHKAAVNLRKHYVAVIVLALAAFCTALYLGFCEFQHSFVFLLFEHVLDRSTAWAKAAEAVAEES